MNVFLFLCFYDNRYLCIAFFLQFRYFYGRPSPFFTPRKFNFVKQGHSSFPLSLFHNDNFVTMELFIVGALRGNPPTQGWVGPRFSGYIAYKIVQTNIFYFKSEQV